MDQDKSSDRVVTHIGVTLGILVGLCILAGALMDDSPLRHLLYSIS